MVHMCKMIISLGVFFIFFKGLIFQVVWVKGKKESKITKNSVHHAPYLRNHT